MGEEMFVEEGEIGMILRVVNNQTLISTSRLEKLVCSEFSTDAEYEKALKFVLSKKLSSKQDEFFRLTSEGKKWIDDRGKALEVEPDDVGEESGSKQPFDASKVTMESKPLSVFQVVRKITRGEIDLLPDFQRAFVWGEIKQSRLIESILLRIPLPAFYLDATDPEKWSVVDGLQRLTTMSNFCSESSFKLEGLEFLTELEGLTFQRLPARYRILIEDDTQFQFYNLMPGTPVKAKYTIFSRVNTGGMQLTPQEIRHALNPGPIRPLLANLASGRAFREATMGVVKSLRMDDRELILRGLAFMYRGMNIYREFGELDGFLLHAMAELNEESPEVLAELEAKMEDAMEKGRLVFGRYAFRKFYEIGGRRGPLNKALFEVWVNCIQKYSTESLKNNKEEINREFVDLLCTSESFLKSISASTGSFSAVNTRFNEIESLLEGILDD